MWQCLSKEQHICQSEGEICYNSNSYSKLSGKMLHFRLFLLKDEKTERCFPKNATGKEIFKSIK